MLEWQIRNILYSGIVGDAIGVPVEFKQRDSYIITGMSGDGTWEQLLGSWSDDTSFTLPLIEALTNNESYEQLMQKFEDYMFHNEYTPDHLAFGIGQGCAKAVRNWSINHYPATQCGDPSEYANGNGALMRLAPLAIYLRNETDLTKRLRITRDYTCLTHRHARSILGSYLYLEILHGLLNGYSLTAALAMVSQEIRPVLDEDSELAQEMLYYQPLFQKGFAQSQRSNVKSTGYVVDTLLAVVWCVLNTTKIDQAILLAVNLGEDTDTIASITGTMASCLHQDQKVDPTWKKQLRNTALLEEIIEPFVKKESRD